MRLLGKALREYHDGPPGGATASRHATALRNAGLIVSRRHGGTVMHSLTPLGRGLRDGS